MRGVRLTMSPADSIRCILLVVLVSMANGGCGAPVEEHRDTPYWYAAYDDAENLRLLIEQGLDVNAQYRHGVTLLHIAAQDGSIDVVRLLLSEGAALEVKDNNGYTALFHAAGTDRLEIVKLLLQAGAEPNVVGRRGNCPLTVAVAESNLEVAAFLREYGARECD